MKKIIEKLEGLKVAASLTQSGISPVAVQAVIDDLKAYDDKVQGIIKSTEAMIEFERRNK